MKSPAVWYEDVLIECINCRGMFLWTGGEQAFFAKQGYPAPKRCPRCRKAKGRQGLERPSAKRLYK